MSFTQSTFAPISSHGNSNSPNIWTYRSTDTFATISAEDYFINKYPNLNNGDSITIDASDKSTTGFFVESGGKFTIQEFVPGGTIKTANNVIIINEEADFDTQDATTITLSPGSYYQIGDSFSTTKRFITQGSTLRGLNLATTLTYTGSGSMFTNTNANFDIADIIIDCPSATVFECIGDDTGNPAHRVNAMALQVNDCVKLLTSTGAGAQVFDLIQLGNVTGSTAVSFTGTSPALVLHFSKIAFIGMTAGSVGFDFGSMTSLEIELANISMFGDPTATAISGLAGSGNIITGNLGSVSLCSFSAFTTPLSGISETDIRWNFTGNAGVPNSLSDGLISTSANALETTIATQGVSVKLNAVFVGSALSRFASDGLGRLTYIGETPIRLPIDVIATLLSASGGDKQLGICIAINGTEVSATCFAGTASNTKAATIASVWQHTFVTNDFVEIFAFNDSSDVNLTGTDAVLRIN